MSARSIGVATAISLSLALMSENAFAERPWRMTTGLEVGTRRERLEVDLAGAHYREDRNLTSTRFDLGFRMPWLEYRGWTLSGQSQIGVGWVFETGHPNVAIHQAALIERPLARGLTLPVGLALGGVIDTASTARSAFEIGFPVGVRYRAFELLWQPSLVVPIGHEREPVFTGEKRLGTAPGFVALAFVGRVLF